MLQRTYLTGLAIALLAAQACGSDDGKKKAQRDTDAGMAGQAGSPEVNAGGSAGSPGETPVEGGTGGAPPEVPVGGMGGVPDVVETGGAGGEPSPPPDPELLFTVRGQGGTPGLPGTAVSAAEHPQNVIYTSKTGRQERIEGSNAVKVMGADMGLLETDPIAAFSLVQPEPTKPLFLFSVVEGTEGAAQSRVNRAYNSADDNEHSLLYYSEGTPSTRYVGEGGDEYGYNAVLASEVSLGLAPRTPDGPPADDLLGLAVHDALQPLGDLYFTVPSYAAGVADSGVATVAANERACTVFKTARDGTNSVAFSCADLGLAPDDQIDGLALWGDGTPTQAIFSVNINAVGAAGSGVATMVATDTPVGATLFKSAGDGANAVLKGERDLGLGEHYYDDEIDGFTVVEAPATPSVAHAASCNLAYDPYAGDAGDFATLLGVSHVGLDVLVLFGQTSTQTNRLLAYNAATCALLQQKDMPVGFEDPKRMAIVPLTGWSGGKPLDKVEFLAALDGTTGLEKVITRYDAAGTFVASFPIEDSYYGWNITALVHDPLADRLFMLVDGYPYRYATLFTMPRPLATDTSLPNTSRDLTSPCANETGITGTDAAGNLFLTKLQKSATDLRVCAFTPTGEVLPLPYWWSTQDTMPSIPYGFVAANGTHFVMHEVDGSISIERGAFQAP